VQTLLERRQSLLVFPEGTRSVDGRVSRFRGGIFLLAIESGLPVAPVAIRGSRHVMKKGRLMTCPGEVSLEVLQPIATTGLTHADAKSLAQRVQRIVAAALAGDEVQAVATGAEAPGSKITNTPSTAAESRAASR
jgi:1-acyl-sn-glycerol-3-phosphate acyltransferase